jgi:hypothetical protein
VKIPDKPTKIATPLSSGYAEKYANDPAPGRIDVVGNTSSPLAVSKMWSSAFLVG